MEKFENCIKQKRYPKKSATKLKDSLQTRYVQTIFKSKYEIKPIRARLGVKKMMNYTYNSKPIITAYEGNTGKYLTPTQYFPWQVREVKYLEVFPKINSYYMVYYPSFTSFCCLSLFCFICF